MKVLLLFLILVLFSCTEPKESESIIGTYALIEWKGISADGTEAYPYGEKAEGQLIYDAQGNMSMHLQKGQRSLLGTDDYDRLDSARLLSAYKTFFSYYGTYTTNEQAATVTHIIDGCKNPDWVGRKLKRRFALTENELIIRSDSVIGMDHILRWERLSMD